MKAILPITAAALMLAGCGLAKANSLDGNDDMTCSVVAYQKAFKSPVQLSEKELLSTFIQSAWYNKQIDHKPDAAKGKLVLDAIKGDAGLVEPAARTCADRAAANPGFASFAREAGEAFDLVAAEQASSAHQR